MSARSLRHLLPFLACLAIALSAPAIRADDAAATAPADEPAPRAEWSLTYASRYAFQGIDYSEGRAVLQPWAALHAGPLTGTVWANANQARHRFDEVDLGVQTPWATGPVSGTAGWLYLRYPNRDWAATHELVVECAANAALSPTLSLHWDVAEGDGLWWTAGASREFASPVGEWQLAAKLHGQEHYYAMTGLPAAETTLGLTIESGGLSFAPSVTRVWSWDNGDWRGDVRPQPAWQAGLTIAPK